MSGDTKPELFEEDSNFPRVLILSEEIPHTFNAGSAVLYRLFKNWPPTRLLIAGPPVPKDGHRLNSTYVSYSPLFAGLDRSRFAKLSRLLTLSGLRAMVPRNDRLMAFKPDMLLTVMQSISYYDSAYRMARKHDLPLVLIVHDDPEDFERTFVYTRRLLQSRNRQIYRDAERRLCISPELAEVLFQRYGVKGEILYPNRDESISPRNPEESLKLKNPHCLTLGYAGSLTYGYGERLSQLIPGFKASKVHLRIYSRNSPTFEAEDTMTYVGRFNSWEAIKSECDAVILPYCFSEHGHQNLYQTHFPSKLTEYLALGMPIIIGGPDYATGVQWGLRNPDACIVITERGAEAWVESLARMREDPNLRMRLSRNSVAAGDRDFDPLKIRDTFLRILQQVKQGRATLSATKE